MYKKPTKFFIATKSFWSTNNVRLWASSFDEEYIWPHPPFPTYNRFLTWKAKNDNYGMSFNPIEFGFYAWSSVMCNEIPEKWKMIYNFHEIKILYFQKLVKLSNIDFGEVIPLHSAHLVITANVTELRQNTLKCTWSDADYCASFSFFISGLFGYKFYIQSPRVKMAL